MAAYSLTSANVALVTGKAKQGTSLEALTAGMPLYTDGSRGIFGPGVGKADSDAAAKSVCIGVALNDVTAVNQPVSYAGDAGDVVTYGAIFTINTAVIVGNTAGALHPIADNTATWYGMLVGVPYTTSYLRLVLHNSGVVTA